MKYFLAAVRDFLGGLKGADFEIDLSYFRLTLVFKTLHTLAKIPNF